MRTTTNIFIFSLVSSYCFNQLVYKHHQLVGDPTRGVRTKVFDVEGEKMHAQKKNSLIEIVKDLFPQIQL